MAVIADCPACQGGDHGNHVQHWGKRAEGVIDGEFCYCSGDCAERAEAFFDKWLGPILRKVPTTALSDEAQALLADLNSDDHERQESARVRLNALAEKDFSPGESEA